MIANLMIDTSPVDPLKKKERRQHRERRRQITIMMDTVFKPWPWWRGIDGTGAVPCSRGVLALPDFESI